MGIVNVTPDSFSDGGMHVELDAACTHAHRLIAEGAQIVDVGGESTRPGSQEVTPEVELARVLPVVQELATEGLCVSIDTRHAIVARACAEAGAAIINDVSGFRNPDMVEIAAACDVGVVAAHMLGEPLTMQVAPHYDDVVAEVCDYLSKQARMLENAGVDPERICVDPGPGFGKNYEHNRALLQGTAGLASLGYPLMAAWSRKGFIGEASGIESASQRVASSVVVACYAAMQGARIIRVHDVAPTAEALRTLATIGLL
jgi:dihydropteroate synthase